jgi:hypothetical protein
MSSDEQVPVVEDSDSRVGKRPCETATIAPVLEDSSEAPEGMPPGEWREATLSTVEDYA